MRRTIGAVVATGLAVALVSCSAGAGEPTSSVTDLEAFTPSAGSDVPEVEVKFGMKPFPNSTLYSIGITRGYFEDVGIMVTPEPYGTAVTPDTVMSLLESGSIDVATLYGPAVVQVMSQLPDVRMFGFSDTYEATYLLASPDSGVESASDRIADGEDPEQAIKDAIAEVEGRGVAFNNSGSQRVFLNTIFDLGGLTFEDVELHVTDDAKIVQLAANGEIEFATPDGAAQNVQLLGEGWYPLVSVNDLAAVPGNEEVVSASWGHEGLGATDAYLQENPETALRLLSVMYRIVDDILGDPDSAVADQLPYLVSRSGVDIGVEGLKYVYEVIDPVVAFEDQAQFYSADDLGPKNYRVMYAEQVKAAQGGGILPEEEFDLGRYFVGERYYDLMLSLRDEYLDLAADDSALEGASAELAEQAAQHFEWHNYLDALRLLKAAHGQ